MYKTYLKSRNTMIIYTLRNRMHEAILHYFKKNNYYTAWAHSVTYKGNCNPINMILHLKIICA